MQITRRLVVQNTSLNVLGQVLPLGVGLVSVPFIVRGFGPELFGLLSLVWIVLAYSSLFELGIGKATTKLVAESSPDQIPRIVWTSLIVQLFLGCGGLLIGWYSTPVLTRLLSVPEGSVDIFRIVSCSLPIIMSTGTLRGALEGGQFFVPVNILKSIGNSGLFLVPLVGIGLDWSLPTIVLGMVILKGVVLVAYLRACLDKFPELWYGTGGFHLETVRKLVRFGTWSTIYSACLLVTYVDRLIVGSLLSLAAVAYYTAAYEIVTRLWIIPWSLTLTLFPAFSNLEKEGKLEGLEELYSQSVRYLMLLVLPIVLVLVLFGGWILDWYLGAEYSDNSTTLLRILGVGILLNCLAFVPYSLFQGIGRPDIPAKVVLVLLPIHLVLVWVLVSTIGLEGAAIGWLIWAGMGGIILWYLANRAVRQICRLS